MLTDMIVEEGFEHNEEELWYSRKDLEQDLHLAAQLGKTLLDRNHELEQGLQQMYSTNQEQLQEIEYLTKQVELLRQMNDQHAKMYEQLDTAARDLEMTNHSLVLDNRTAQGKIQSLTETIDSLQVHMESLQKQVDELKAAQCERSRKERAEARRSLAAQSISCLKELYDLHQDTRLSCESLSSEHVWQALDARQMVEEENASLQSTLRTLQAQLVSEREQREAAERAAELTDQENRVLEHRATLLEGAQRRLAELEAEVEELRLLWRSEAPSTRPTDALLPDSVFFPSEEKVKPEEEEKEEEEPVPERRRCSSESYVRGTWAEELRRGHDRTCVRRTEGHSQAVRQRGISLLNEVDAQYSALQVKYEELLRRCQRGADGLSHKAVQTPASRRSSSVTTVTTATASMTVESGCPADELHQPEYKTLFKEIFTCIQKTKEDLSENRATLSQQQ
ncbi:cerebellar degeneration-related protein 2 [Colossoma macropomum]|uniref:cerebellar degeneration-related protein 2 n=1 Tax=Colossoma macropomum TaxID=42526 RepID=UPI00186539B3|nr:cerebellar degeneration-related protein 2 [Colossoma macropomum]